MFFSCLIVSCENDLDQVIVVTEEDDTPDEVVNNMHTIYSDSGIVKFEIIASRMEKYSGETQLTIFKHGFKVNFFKGKDVIESTLSAEYAEMRPLDKTIIARNNVIFTNYIEDQTLETEQLTWYQATKRIVTKKPFHVTDRKKNYEAWGTGLDADESFTDYEMHDVQIEKEINK